MAVQFNQIAAQINTPGAFVEIDPSLADTGLALQPHETLLIGQKLSGGLAVAGQVYSVSSVAEAISLFGQHSQLAQMYASYRSKDRLTPVWAIGLEDDGGGVAATGAFTFTGTATESGELVLYVDGRRVAVGVENGDTASDVETAALAALQGLDNSPATYAPDATVDEVDVTAQHAGTIGNYIRLGHSLQAGEKVPAGLTVAITQMTGGSVDPDYTTAVTAMGEEQYHTVALGVQTKAEVDKIIAEMESRENGMRQIEGVSYHVLADTSANLTTAGNSYNSFVHGAGGVEQSALTPSVWEIAALTAAIDARQTQTDPAQARTGLDLGATVKAPERGNRFTRAQRDVLIGDGVTTYRATSDGRMAIDRLISTYQTNSSGIASDALQDMFAVRTLFAIRFSIRARIAGKFARFKLQSDGVPIPSGQKIVNPSIIRGELIALFQEWASVGWVDGATLDQYKNELVVEIDGSDPNRVNAVIPPDIINNMLVFAAAVRFRR